MTCLVALQRCVHGHQHPCAAQTRAAVSYYGLVRGEVGKLPDETVEFCCGWWAAKIGPKRVVEVVDLVLSRFTVMGQCEF